MDVRRCVVEGRGRWGCLLGVVEARFPGAGNRLWNCRASWNLVEKDRKAGTLLSSFKNLCSTVLVGLISQGNGPEVHIVMCWLI